MSLLPGAEPPVIVPVHNLGAGGNTPPFWLPPPRGLGWRHAMFNAFFLGDGHRVSALGSLYAWVDSGAFLFLEAPQRRLAGLHRRRREDGRGGGAPSGWSEDLVEEVLRRQERFGASVAFTLDYPLPPRSQVDPGCCPGTVAERIRLTARAAALAYQLRRRSGIRLLVVLQYNSPEALQRLLATLERELHEHAGMGLGDVDGYAVGGLVPHSAKWWLLAQRLQQARRLLGWGTWIHLLGVASPRNTALLYAAGADSMDSKTYIIAAAKRLYYQPNGAKPARISLREADPSQKPLCTCPGCTRHQTLQEMRHDTQSIALHNLSITLQAAAEARQACTQGELHNLLKNQARSDPRLRKALSHIHEPRPC
ncbi:tRNA-guanine family transglycosylase [Pyrodictium delaneyi]|uniref:tRNA-guanine family transglycosylase n=1 Tax=Pyrodictium delaneyi TaxID=1273541 RepID=A0A0P0N479_9CREN|nr:tRNA-guanine transglycosylase [Pyrodictium delaneyi]ALL01411.1 tRNA-guanine family transglycosylase [Pyrodictium delaneyi]OWJ54489.1 hypothetical protein Pdsh_06750 [Pyrodictium delaneyi]OWJ54669.1 hypothetical protein Pdsh_06535 [Pyrodictium delaneyi]